MILLGNQGRWACHTFQVSFSNRKSCHSVRGGNEYCIGRFICTVAINLYWDYLVCSWARWGFVTYWWAGITGWEYRDSYIVTLINPAKSLFWRPKINIWLILFVPLYILFGQIELFSRYARGLMYGRFKGSCDYSWYIKTLIGSSMPNRGLGYYGPFF